ncbi:type II toxin-antitoxin system Phd/YefM family antitoxin [Eubacteriales bacterium OttesenSCG-928-A19]|nr:type II toxin-antitoxin system Phd/YefM family antitoxin [Eubacteriales bacterium OttesenSCG-928-A19]
MISAMMTIKTGDLATKTREVAKAIINGETVIVSRPKNENWVILSEAEYNEVMKAKRNAEYIAKLDRAEENIKAGRVVVFESVEALEEWSNARFQEAESKK